MADKPQTKYVDADKLMANIYQAMPPSSYGYTSDPMSQAINNQISQAVTQAFSVFIANLQGVINNAATPYENDKCMLCKQRDWDIKPDCAV